MKKSLRVLSVTLADAKPPLTTAPGCSGGDDGEEGSDRGAPHLVTRQGQERSGTQTNIME